MNHKERVIRQIFRLLDVLETDANHSVVAQIRGLLNELINS